jgi:lipopolysaccharide export system permease protein
VLAGERVISDLENLPAKAQRSIDLLRQPSQRNQGELVWRLGLVLGSANLLLLGIGLAATNPRRPSNWNVLLALLTFVVYYNIINLTQAWVAGAKVGMGVALAATHGGAFAAAMGLLWWRDSRNSRGLLRRLLLARSR